MVIDLILRLTRKNKTLKFGDWSHDYLLVDFRSGNIAIKVLSKFDVKSFYTERIDLNLLERKTSINLRHLRKLFQFQIAHQLPRNIFRH